MSTATADLKKDAKKKNTHPRDPVRESVETIVFVVVLVLLLKLFVTEAFVIPTGSMAETLYGYQKMIVCQQCSHEFPVNSHDEVEANQMTGRRHPLVGYTCPNCRFTGRVQDLNPQPTNRTGDRVLVLKPIYHLQDPERGDIVVFKYPEKPQENQTAQNYIKRAMGFGGETIAIHRGDLYVTTALRYPGDARDESGEPLYPRPEDPKDLWRPQYMYENSQVATDLFEASRQAGFPEVPINELKDPEQRKHFEPLIKSGAIQETDVGFHIVRRVPDQVLACRRIVWDNDKQPKELVGRVPPRWYVPESDAASWKPDNPDVPRQFQHTDANNLHWIRYRHLIDVWGAANNEGKPEPRFIDNFLGYNAGIDLDPQFRTESSRASTNDDLWVGNLVIECEAEIQGGSEVVLELSKGQNRFQAIFGKGQVKLTSTGPGARDFGSRECGVNETGKYKLRFANVDSRLLVWVNDDLIDFGTDADYSPSSVIAADKVHEQGYTEENDIAAPASIGARGDVIVRSIQLHRDIYYTKNSTGDHAGADIFYVQPGHYLCLGDNSAQSSDSRKWGTVPDRLMLGKAVFVFFPLGRMGFIE